VKYARLLFCIWLDFFRRNINFGDETYPSPVPILSFLEFVHMLFFWQVIFVEGWHDLDNKDYDCWPLEKPDEYNMLDCGGE